MNKHSRLAAVVSSKTFAVSITAIAMYAANVYSHRMTNAYMRDRHLNADFRNYIMEKTW